MNIEDLKDLEEASKFENNSSEDPWKDFDYCENF